MTRSPKPRKPTRKREYRWTDYFGVTRVITVTGYDPDAPRAALKQTKP